MKSKIIFIISCLIVFLILYKWVYKPYVWQKAMHTEAHKLQIGSYIFTTGMEHNGSQSFEKSYTIFKVIAIKDDYVRLAVVREFYSSEKAFDGYYSADKFVYEDAKERISNTIVTPVLTKDISDYNNLVLTSSLLKKYPNLSKSRFFVEDVTNDIKPTKESPIYGSKYVYFSLVYSKIEILENAELVPYVYGNSVKYDVELLNQYSQDIDIIINPKK